MTGTATPDPQFKDMFNTPGLPVEISGGELRDHIQFTQENYHCKYAQIKGAVFFENVDFENVNLGVGIKFQNCKFLKGLSFKNCRAEGYEREFNSDSVSVYFDQCEIGSLNLPVINHFERGFKVYNKCKVSHLNIDDLQIPNGSLRIDESSVEERFRFSNVNVGKNGEIAVVKSTVKSSVRYENLLAGGIGFLNSTIEGDVYVWAGKTTSFVFNNGKFAEDFNLIGIKSDQTSIIGADFSKLLTIDFDDSSNDIFGYHKNIFLAGSKFGIALELTGPSQANKSEELEQQQSIEQITIACNRSQDGTIQLSQCQINEAKLKGNLKNGNIRFDSCEFKVFLISDFTNSATVSLVSCKAISDPESLFEIENSNVGKLELLNCSLRSFNKIRLADSLIIDIVAMGVDWFDDQDLIVATSSNDHKGKREVYRQLKQVCEKQGDRIQALEFQSLELSSFRMGLRLKDKWRQELTILRNQDRTSKIWYDKDRWILRFSTTNDFGLHWSKPVWWILALTILIFFPLIVAAASPELDVLPAKSLNDIALSFRVFWNHIEVLPQLFNPARVTTRMFPNVPENKLGFATHAWDGLQRIVLAFFIVQVVAAFRKYVRN
jgi:hypothetical protein